jgi:hypothetical protein
VDSLEQVRLTDTVRADDENEPRLQGQLEPLIGAKVAERGGLDDQTLLTGPAFSRAVGSA